MATETSKRDPNYVTTLMGVDMTTGFLPTKVYVDEATHRLLVSAIVSSSPSPSALVAFVTPVPTAGSRVNLAANAILGGVLQAPSTNTGIIYVGGVTVSSSVYGAELQPGQATGIAVSNTNLLYIDASVNGDKCAFIGS